MAISKVEKHIVPSAVRGAASSWLQETSDSKRQSCCSVIIKWRFNEERTRLAQLEPKPGGCEMIFAQDSLAAGRGTG